MASTPSTLAAWPCGGGSPALCHAHPRWLHNYHVMLCCCPAVVKQLQRTGGGVRTLPGACLAWGACRVSRDALCCGGQYAAGQCPAGIKHLGQMACALKLSLSPGLSRDLRSAYAPWVRGHGTFVLPCLASGLPGAASLSIPFMLGVLPLAPCPRAAPDM